MDEHLAKLEARLEQLSEQLDLLISILCDFT
jgi:hypothetical protein